MGVGLPECESAGRRWRVLQLKMRQTMLLSPKTAMDLEA